MSMNIKRSQILIEVSQLPNILLEQYNYSAGAVQPLSRHSHQEYQLGMSFNCQGQYFYRGAYHNVPVGSLSIIHSGEVHSPSERTYLPQPATFWMMHVNPNLLAETALEIGNQAHLPFFTEPIFSDCTLVRLFYNLCLNIQLKTSELEQDSAILDFFAYLLTCQTKLDFQSDRVAKGAIALVCDYLQANYHQNISLAELADLVGMSRFYLSRLFRRSKGISLSAYQTQIKIDRAKKLLSQEMPISQVATATGFYDQSHFGYHFKRLVGTTPGNYSKGQ
ncbi:MAG: AraC family transcriptional regulator [Cyanobacteria bacterium P01_A01_bin.83]